MSATWNSVNHYLAEKFFILIGRDSSYAFYNGQIAYLNANLGKGAFRATEDFKHED